VWEDAEEDGCRWEARRRRTGSEGCATQHKRMSAKGRRGDTLEYAFEERGMANLHSLSPPMQFASRVCMFCWRGCIA
jgi:hypothetical protein